MSGGSLVQYDAACKALALAKNTDEVKKIGDAAVVLRAYAKQAKNKQLELDAAEIRIRAERRLGELIAAQGETVGLAKGTKRDKGSTAHGHIDGGVRGTPPSTPTLADAGIDKNLAKRARKLAVIPQKQFEAQVEDWREHSLRDTARISLPTVSAPPATPRGPSRELPHQPSAGATLCHRIAALLDDFDQLAREDQQLVLVMLERTVRELREQSGDHSDS